MADEPENERRTRRPNLILVGVLFLIALAFYVGAFFMLGD